MIGSNVSRRAVIGGIAAGASAATVVSSGTFIGEARAQAARKTFVLIPGAFCGAWCWRRVSDGLEKQGHKVYSLTLTGLADRSHLLSKDVNLDTHIADIVNLVESEDLSDICLVAHSYGGFPASGALERIGNRVSSLVMVDALKPNDGQSVLAAPPAKLSGAREQVAKKTYIRLPIYVSPAMDKAYAETKADKSWTVFENTTSGHMIMINEPESLTPILLQAS